MARCTGLSRVPVRETGAKSDRFAPTNHETPFWALGERRDTSRGHATASPPGGVAPYLVTPIRFGLLIGRFFRGKQAGHAFSLALTSEGEVYGWGRNDAGQLGLGGGLTMDVYAMENDPRLVELLAGEKVGGDDTRGRAISAASVAAGPAVAW